MPDEGKSSVWRWMFEGFVFVLVVAGIGWCCWKGCLISKQPRPSRRALSSARPAGPSWS